MVKKKEDAIEKFLDGINFKNLKAKEITGENGLLKLLTKRVIEKAMNAEMDDHLGYPKHKNRNRSTNNSRNGNSKKTLTTDIGNVDINIPRDRLSDFNPKIVKKHQRRFEGFDDKIISMYGRGMTVRDIRSHLEDIYGVDVSPDLITDVTDAIINDAKEWLNRPLDNIYPIVYFDGIVVKGRTDRKSTNKTVYLAIGINMQGRKEVLGLWIGENEGAKFWMGIISELNNRGLKDILIACIDGLKGFPDAIQAVFSETKIQLCIVHMIRNSTKFVSYKDRKEICNDLKRIYTASTEQEGIDNLEWFGDKWNKKYPMIYKSWKNNWENLNEFFAYPPEIRKVIYTTNAIESLNYSLRKVTKNRGAFPTDDAITKIMYLALTNASKRWTMPIKDWGAAINQFAVYFGNRVPV